MGNKLICLATILATGVLTYFGLAGNTRTTSSQVASDPTKSIMSRLDELETAKKDYEGLKAELLRRKEVQKLVIFANSDTKVPQALSPKGVPLAFGNKPWEFRVNLQEGEAIAVHLSMQVCLQNYKDLKKIGAAGYFAATIVPVENEISPAGPHALTSFDLNDQGNQWASLSGAWRFKAKNTQMYHFRIEVMSDQNFSPDVFCIRNGSILVVPVNPN